MFSAIIIAFVLTLVAGPGFLLSQASLLSLVFERSPEDKAFRVAALLFAKTMTFFTLFGANIAVQQIVMVLLQ